MARSVATIQASILANIASNPNLTYVDGNGQTQPLTNNTSIYAIFNLFAYIVAVAQATLEQLMDLYVATIEGIVNRSAAANSSWLQAKMFAFQYSASTPQIATLVNGVVAYPVVDDTLKIITACAISVDITNTVNIKVATGAAPAPLAALSSPQLQAAQSYANLGFVDGIKYNLISLDPDRIYITAQIYYNGMYSSTMQATIIATITNYLQQLSLTRFDGSLLMSDLESLLRGITGVNDVVLNNVSGRPNTTAYPGGVSLIANNTILQRSYASKAGYMISEDTAGYTLADSLNLIAQ